MKQIRTLKFDGNDFSQGHIERLNHLFPSIEHIYKWTIQSRSDLIYIIDQFKQLTSISFFVDKPKAEIMKTSEFDSDLIVNDIQRYLHCNATCRIEILSESTHQSQWIHLWLEDRVSWRNLHE